VFLQTRKDAEMALTSNVIERKGEN